jgi:hypothetical protein
MNNARIRGALAVCLALWPTSALGASAQSGDADAETTAGALRSRISAVGACPLAEGVATTIEGLIPQHVTEVSRRDPKISVADMGHSYRVNVLADGVLHVRVYRDVGRDCAHRARVTAVFAVLTLMPPEVMLESPPLPPAPTPPPLISPPPPVPLPSWRVSLAVAGVTDVAPAVLGAPSSLSAGGEIRIAVRRHRVAAELGLGFQPSSEFALAGLSARQQRLPLDISVAFRQPVRAIELAAAVGVATAVFHVAGVDPPVTTGGTRIDLGIRAGAEVRIGRAPRSVAAFVGLHALYFPRQYELVATPAGVVGRTPSLWIGANAGVVWLF